jgi:hypothetical protein
MASHAREIDTESSVSAASKVGNSRRPREDLSTSLCCADPGILGPMKSHPRP